jgi:hypothetical protein
VLFVEVSVIGSHVGEEREGVESSGVDVVGIVLVKIAHGGGVQIDALLVLQ